MFECEKKQKGSCKFEYNTYILLIVEQRLADFPVFGMFSVLQEPITHMIALYKEIIALINIVLRMFIFARHKHDLQSKPLRQM